uniref:Uncharacterized protein n=1 Tax=Pipistrellus kuhlii TaxID=59472 RepID=A0A7J7VBZ3_PIPKU|nr:hypothetical protein mPipKuh1_008497 [Pipistrellus kuhlii]
MQGERSEVRNAFLRHFILSSRIFLFLLVFVCLGCVCVCVCVCFFIFISIHLRLEGQCIIRPILKIKKLRSAEPYPMSSDYQMAEPSSQWKDLSPYNLLFFTRTVLYPPKPNSNATSSEKTLPGRMSHLLLCAPKSPW